MLHTIHGRNSYCFPAALSALTGETTDLSARRIRRATGKRRVTGVNVPDTLLVMLQGYGQQHTSFRQVNEVLTLDHIRSEEPSILLLWPPTRDNGETPHSIAVHDGQVADNGCYLTRDPRVVNEVPETLRGWRLWWTYTYSPHDFIMHDFKRPLR